MGAFVGSVHSIDLLTRLADILLLAVLLNFQLSPLVQWYVEGLSYC